MKLKIKVTRSILLRSAFCNIAGQNCPPATKCAISYAVRDVFPNAVVGREALVFFDDQPISPYANLPQSTSDYIFMFDNSSPTQRMEMPEHEFEIEVPEAVIDSINIEALEACSTMELVSD